MDIKLPTNVVKFANGNSNAYEMFADYYRQYSAEVLNKNIGAYQTQKSDGTAISFAEKETKVHEAMLAEIERFAGCKRPEGVSNEMWASNPSFKWATFAVVTMMIETILPSTIVDSIGLYTDIRNVGFGDVPLFTIPPRSLFTTSLGSNAQRTTLIQKQYKGNATIPVFNHVITTSVDLYKVLAGRQSLAEFARIVVLSIETSMTREAYDAVVAGLTGVSRPAALKIEGAFDMATLIKLCQTVEAYNFGMKPIIAGTPLALLKVLPDSADGYRLMTGADAPVIGLMRNVLGYDVMPLKQVATGNYNDYSTVLNDNLLFVLSPAADKLLKGVIEGATLSNSNDYYDNADLTSNFTMNKRYGFEFLSGAVSGSYNITG